MKTIKVFENCVEFETQKGKLNKPYTFFIDETNGNILVVESEGVIVRDNDDKYVDLGLPSGKKWMKCNLGANSETECGDYYMWGSTTPNTNEICDWAHAPFNNGSKSLNREYFDGYKCDFLDENNNLKPEYDAVYQATNGVAHMPTKDDFKELLANTSCKWIVDYNGSGVDGMLFTSKTNGNSIFIPTSGGRLVNSVNNNGLFVYLWSSSLFVERDICAYSLSLDSDRRYTSYGCRVNGFCLRGVL